MANHDMDPEKFRSTMNSLAYGDAMGAAARDYMKEMEAAEEAANARPVHNQVAMDDFMDDPELAKIHRDRMQAMQKEQEKRQEMSRAGHGEVTTVPEGEFLEVVTNTPYVVCHFFHADFERCKIVDKHLELVAKKYFDTRVIKVSAPDSPFFSVKLEIKILPCVVMFQHGVAIDRVTGFEEFGRDDFTSWEFENRLKASGVLVAPKKGEDDSDEEIEHEQIRNTVMKSMAYGSGDESSDFDD